VACRACKQTVNSGRPPIRCARHGVRDPSSRDPGRGAEGVRRAGWPGVRAARAGGCPEGVRGTHRSATSARGPTVSAWRRRRPTGRLPRRPSSPVRAAPRRWNGATGRFSARAAGSRWAAARGSPATAARRRVKHQSEPAATVRKP
jgi:hypothetical protein